MRTGRFVVPVRPSNGKNAYLLVAVFCRSAAFDNRSSASVRLDCSESISACCRTRSAAVCSCCSRMSLIRSAAEATLTFVRNIAACVDSTLFFDCESCPRNRSRSAVSCSTCVCHARVGSSIGSGSSATMIGGAMETGVSSGTTTCRAFSIAAARIRFVVTSSNRISDPIVQTSTARNGKSETPAALLAGRRDMGG